MERPRKVVRLNGYPITNEVDVDGGDRIDSNEICYMDKLPNEILMKILDYLDEQELVKCRILNSRWNEISCLLLPAKTKNNPKSKLIIKLRRAHGKNHLSCKTIIEKALGDFVTCFSPSKAEKLSNNRRPFPFSRFKVQDLSHIKESQMLQFVSTFGPHMKSLTLDVKQKDVKNFVKFWKLLLKYAPNIQHLGITGGPWLNGIKLFNSKSNSSENINVCSFLQNLKSIKVTADQGFDDFLKNLLNHAPNVKEVMSSEFPLNGVTGLENFSLWQRLEKSHLIKKFEMVSFDASKNYLPPVDLMKNARLDYLKVDCGIFSVSKEKAISYVNHAIKSSQDSLSSLKLDNLTTENMDRCFKDVSSLPNVQKLQIEMQDDSSESEIITILIRFSELCPNLTYLIIDGLHGEFVRIAPILWTQFEGLKYLKVPLYVNDGLNNVLSLTCGLSGYSILSIQKTKEKLNNGISVDEARGGEAQGPSIFDLKELSRLEIVCLFPVRRYELEDQKAQVEESLLVKMLPQHLRENPRTFDYQITDAFDSSDSDSISVCSCRFCRVMG